MTESSVIDTKPIYAARDVTALDALLAVFCCEQGVAFVPAPSIPNDRLSRPARQWLAAFELRRQVLVIEEANLAAGRLRWP